MGNPYGSRVPPVADRFHEKVAYAHPSKCWDWCGRKDYHGYGYITEHGRKRQAHRLSWALWHGRDIPADLVVMHRCDRPSCVNPFHLQLGTRKQNQQDMAAKGRHRVPSLGGERNPHAKLSDADVIEVRNRLASGESGRSIARSFGVTDQLISLIKHGHRST